MTSIRIVLVLLAMPFVVQARLNVVSLPGRDSVQLTIYNSVDLTLVKETRHLTFRKGLNRLEFSWANTLIDPTSLELRAVTHADEIELLEASFPPRVTNTLEWRINSEFAGEIEVEIRYFTSGIHWAADYVAEAHRTETAMNFGGYVRVTNNSGEDYEHAQIRLVVGVIRLVEEIANLARAGRPGPLTALAQSDQPAEGKVMLRAAYAAMDKAEKLAAAAPREVLKEGVGEYFLYTVEGRDTIPNGWAKRLPSFRVADVPLASYYKFEKERWGDRVARYYRFKNDKPSHLGTEPLPDGDVKALRLASDDSLYAFVGSTSVKYIPLNEEVELELGNDLEVLVKPTLINWVKTDVQFDQQGNIKGWTIKEKWQIDLQNSKDIDVMVDVRRHFQGDWALATEAKYEKVDATKAKFVTPLKPREKRTIAYEVTTRHGSNVTR